MTGLMNVTTALTGANILLVGALLYVYGKNLARTRSSFTFGLFLFALLFLVENLFSFYYFATMMPYFVAEVEPFVFFLTVFETLAFVVLNWITWR